MAGGEDDVASGLAFLGWVAIGFSAVGGGLGCPRPAAQIAVRRPRYSCLSGSNQPVIGLTSPTLLDGWRRCFVGGDDSGVERLDDG